MLPKARVTSHPGAILHDEFLKPMKLSQAELARALGIPLNRVNEGVRGKRGVTPKSSLLLAGYFCNSPEFWMNLQTASNLSRTPGDAQESRSDGDTVSGYRCQTPSRCGLGWVATARARATG